MQQKSEARELLVLGALLVFVAGLCLRPMDESDLFFRLKVGQEILARHALPGRNLFSFTAPDHPDLDLAWLFEVAAAVLFRWGGFPAIVVGKTVLVVITFAVAFVVCRRRGAGPLAAVATLVGAAVVMRERLVERPHIVSFLGEVFVLALLAPLSPLEGARPWRRWVLCGLALVLWANAHAGLFVAVALLSLAGLGAALVSCAAAARRAFALAVLAAAAACATPVGPAGIVRYLMLHLTLPRIHTIDEFRHATWRSDAGALVGLMLVGAAVLGAWLVSRRAPPGGDGADADAASPPRAPVLPDLLPAAGVAALGVASVRFSADAALVAAPLLAVSVSALAAAVGRRLFPSPWRSTARPGAPRPLVLVAASGALLVAALGPRVAAARARRPFIDLSVDVSALPLDALRFVEQHGLRDRMYNDFEIGSYLLFEGYPRYRVFVDPRLPAYPEDLHRALGRFDHDRASWDTLMSRYGVDSALLAYAGVNRRVAWWDPERWALVYRAADARVFVRRDPARRAFIAAHEIPLTFEFAVETGATPRPLLDRPAASPVGDCEWQRRLGDVIFDLDGGRPLRARVHYDRALAIPGCLGTTEEAALGAWLGALEVGQSDWARAVSLLDRALALAPDDTRTRANRATALEGLGRRAAAAEEWARVAAAADGSALGTAAAARVRALRR